MTSALYVGNTGSPLAGTMPAPAFTVPVTSGLVGLHFLGHGPEAAVLNFGSGDNASIVGSPSWQEGYATLGASAYLETAVGETSEMTLFCVGRRTGSGNAGFVGNFLNSSNVGVSLFGAASDSKLYGSAGRSSGASVFSLPDSAVNSWRLFSMKVPAAAMQTITDHTAELTVTSGGFSSRVTNGFGPILIGALPAASYVGPTQICAVAIYSRVLGSTETDDVVEWLSTYMDAVGLA